MADVPPAGTDPVTRSTARITTLLALLTAVGPISTDMYLPAFPVMKAALGAAPGQAQLTLASWFVGLAIGQIMHGPLSDRYGRRLPLLVGTTLYTIASIGCALSGSMTTLSWWRLWAAFGGAASLVIPRVIIADVVRGGAEAARMLGRMVMVMSVVPMLAPTLGGVIAEHWNWRAIFWIAALYGALCSVLIHVFLPETLQSHRHGRLRPGEILVRYILVWRGRAFRAHALEGGFATFSLFAFLAGAPMVFLTGYKLTPSWFGTVFIVNALGYVIGTQANARLIGRFGTDRVLTGGSLGLLAVTAAMLGLALGGLQTAPGLAGGMLVCMMALGLVLPGAALGSVLGHRQNAGAASALYGTTVFLIGALSTTLLGWVGSDGPVPMSILMFVGAAAALVCDRTRPR